MTFASRNVMGVSPASPLITTIEWEMLDKRRFYPLSMMSRSAMMSNRMQIVEFCYPCFGLPTSFAETEESHE